MEFDKNRVYTALNADELPVGSKVYVADVLAMLEGLVKCDATPNTLQCVHPKDWACRFKADDNAVYSLAYLVEPPTKLNWRDLKIGDVIRDENSSSEYMVTMRDTRETVVCHIGICTGWLDDSELSNFEKVSLC